MGTPLKSVSLLKRTQRLSPRCAGLLTKSPVIKHHSPHNPLQYPNIPPATTSRRYLFPSHELSPCKFLSYAADDDIDIGCGDKILALNTPNKHFLLKHGINEDKLFNILGKGSFGTVIKGRYKGETVAVKVERIKTTGEFPEMNGLKLNHENVIKTIDVILHQSEDFGLVIMEFCPNSSNLQTVLDKRQSLPFAIEEIKFFSKSITRGVNYLHNRDILHLDIKPRNIIVSDGVCKICDFGNSLKFGQLPEDFNYQGTVAYTDPEILMGKLPTKKSDVYSLGIVLWQIKYRVLPYADLNSNDLIIYKEHFHNVLLAALCFQQLDEQVVKYELRPDRQVVSNFQDTYSKIYSACWESHPELRPNTSEILIMLEHI